MKAGDTLRFIVIDNSTGKLRLLKDLPMELHRASGELVATGVPGKYGDMDFRFPEPGRYVVTTTYRRADPASASAGHWLVDTSTLTFNVR